MKESPECFRPLVTVASYLFKQVLTAFVEHRATHLLLIEFEWSFCSYYVLRS